MRIITILLSLLFVTLFYSSCNKSMEEEFEEKNTSLVEKELSTIQILVDNEDYVTFTFHYDNSGKITSLTDNMEAILIFDYDANDNLSSIELDGGITNMVDILTMTHDAYEVGNVYEYDQVGNPIEIQYYDGGLEGEELYLEIVYSDTPNPYFYTFKAAGIIDVLDQTNLNFGPTTPAIIKARELMPVNNIRSILVKELDGSRVSEVQINYKYDQDKYPQSADVIAFNTDEFTNFSILYTYK